MGTAYYCCINNDIAFEAGTRKKLVEAIARHYSEGYAGPDEDSPPPQYTEMGEFVSDGDGEEILPVDDIELVKFNTEVADAFEAAIEGWDRPSDYDEHNTHWGL